MILKIASLLSIHTASLGAPILLDAVAPISKRNTPASNIRIAHSAKRWRRWSPFW